MVRVIIVRVWVKVKVRVRVSGNVFKYIFGQTSIRGSVLHC